MKIDNELISNLCKLSKLEINDKEKYSDDLKEIITFMNNLNKFDENIIENEKNNEKIFRDDIETSFNNLNQENLITLMRKKNIYIEENYFTVPKIIE